MLTDFDKAVHDRLNLNQKRFVRSRGYGYFSRGLRDLCRNWPFAHNPIAVASRIARLA